MDVIECQNDSNCYCNANETGNKLVLHTGSYQYTTLLKDLKEKAESKFQVDDTTALAEAR